MKGHLNSGETYSLENIFINENNGKVIIPDLQRDYCWGGKGTLVIDFVNNIKEHFEAFRKNAGKCGIECLTSSNVRWNTAHSLMMGLLYGYYEENRPNLQLCDGQQRLTTLFLLIGYINRACGDNSFRRFLISDYELNEDDKEPNLLYDIRDSSLYFLSDLVCNFFIQEGVESVDGPFTEYIRKQDWWFKVYDTDPTIQSMLATMDEIQNLLHDMDKVRLKGLGCYVCRMLHFVFFDMGDRKNGEETFVIINTTGEPLTATENLKPLVVTQGSEAEWEQNSRQWEVVDHWFWLHRDKSKEETSDVGMKEFLRWVAALHLPASKEFSQKEYYKLLNNEDYVFPYKEIGIKEIEMTFDALRQLNEDRYFLDKCNLLVVPKRGKFNLKDYFVILPTLKHFMQFGDKEAAIRIYSLFRNLSRYTEIRTENNNVLLALKAIDCMKEADVCNLLDFEDEVNTTYILTEEEKMRLTIIRENATDKVWREKVEEAFEDISTHHVLSGRISCLIDDMHTFDLERFESNVKRFKILFPKRDADKNVADDKTVLSFAAFCQEQGCNAYPMANGNYRDFGYCASEWNRFIYDVNLISLFRSFLREIDETNIEGSMDRIISRLDSDNPIFYLITKNIPYALWNGDWRKRLRIHPASGLIRLFRNTSYKSDNDVYLLGKEILACRSQSEKWNGWDFYEDGDGHCLYTDHKEYDIAIDLLFSKISEDQYSLRIFKRDKKIKKNLNGLKSLLSGFSPQNNDGRMVSKQMSAKAIIRFIDEMEGKIEKEIESHDK